MTMRGLRLRGFDRFCPAILFAAILLMPLSIVIAQTTNAGTFLGTVKDQTGAVVPEASVRLINQATQRLVTATTDSQGDYRFLEAPEGTYRLEFAKSGFMKCVQAKIPLSSGQSLRVDAVLSVGSTQQAVTVKGSVSTVNTETALVGSHVSLTQIENIPLN